MRKAMIVVLAAAILLVVGGVVGNILTDGRYEATRSYNDKYDYRRGMMQSALDIDQQERGEKYDIEELEERVESYIARYDEKLIISDIFVFDDSDYYFSIMEEDADMGAMELLVNPYTGDIYPEFGPNMMWNLKYGMHANSRYGMMGRGSGMMGRGYSGFYSSIDNSFEENTVTWNEAYELAVNYIDKYDVDGFEVTEEGHEFYGYYTFHLEHNGVGAGMLSINGLTGDVWYHSWHGTVNEIISDHHDEDVH